jgi:hypothetical protein
MAEVVKANGHHASPAKPPFDEPIAQAVHGGARSFSDWWSNNSVSTPLKVIVLLAVAITAIYHGGWLVPTAVVLGSVYLVYLGIRLLVSAAAPRPVAVAAPATTPVALPAAHGPRSTGWDAVSGPSWEQVGRQLLREKTTGDRVGELTGSMLAAAVIAGILTIVMTAIASDSFVASADWRAGPAWLWLCTTLGSWLVLAAGKWCERSSGEAIKRRFGMLVLGLAFGAIAYSTSQFLMVNLDGRHASHGLIQEISRGMYESSGAPRLAAFLAYFGAVFATIGWWKQADPIRKSRLQISAILLTILAAWVWQLVWPFPQPWGFMMVAAISIATQLSSPCFSSAERAAAIAKRKRELA